MDYTAILILACIFIPLERFLPRHEEQKTLRTNWVTDLLHLLFDGFFVRAGFAVIAGWAMVAFRGVVSPDFTDWVQASPIWAQVIAIIIIGDIGYYIAHRSAHEIPFLWKFHAVHHSSEDLDWLASHRLHPIDQIYSNAWQMLPVFFLGFSGGAVATFVLIYQAHALLQHSNVRLKFGPLKFVFTSPDFHHWHHANQREAWDKNYAGQLPILDIIGGTYFLPDREPEKYGLSEPMPRHYHQQLLHPFLGVLKSLKRPVVQKGNQNEQDA